MLTRIISCEVYGAIRGIPVITTHRPRQDTCERTKQVVHCPSKHHYIVAVAKENDYS